MIQLVFKSLDPSYSAAVGPASCFRFTGPSVHASHTTMPVAEHRNLGWDVSGQHYTRFDCSGPVLIHFKGDPGQTSEPRAAVTRFWAADGFLYADGEHLAKFDEGTGLWRNGTDGSSWPVIVVESAA
jgi:hypothetical protein